MHHYNLGLGRGVANPFVQPDPLSATVFPRMKYCTIGPNQSKIK